MNSVHDSKLDIWNAIQSSVLKLVQLNSDISGKSQDKEDIAFMIERARIAKKYKDAYETDHEPTEVNEQMMLIEPTIQQRARLMMYEIDMSERVHLAMDKWDFGTKRRIFFNALKIYEEIYPGEVDRVEMVVKFYSCFCESKAQIRAEIIESSIRGEFEIGDALKRLL